jgi:peptide chain release factor 3
VLLTAEIPMPKDSAETSVAGTAPAAELESEVARRRTFAIISHPDAGKTTLTEKLLLYGGAIHEAGSVKARRAQRHATSDWMAMEQERGISVTSSVMQFDYAGCRVNLLDTPGHADFGEDTYRTLVAADAAVMLLDNRKGVEERTRQLFDVCKRRRTPIFTFVNKCDRTGEDPLKLLSDVEAELGIACYAANWPIHVNHVFVGVYDRRRRQVHVFTRGADHGARRNAVNTGGPDDPLILDLIGAEAAERLRHDIALLDEASHPWDESALRSGELTPVYFGSALTNFGVEPFLEEVLALAPAPHARRAVGDRVVEPTDPAFSGFVFKIQANMDPRHRDRVAFIRVCSGRYEGGMDVRLARTGKRVRLAAPQQFLARERVAVEEAWPGDVVGVIDRGNLRIGDTLSEASDVEFAEIPRFAPEMFARLALADPMKRKQLDTGLRQLTEEGAAQVFFVEGSTSAPVIGAVGQLQFDVMLHRLEHEYGAPCKLERFAYKYPRWVHGPEAEIRRVAASANGVALLRDAKEHPVFVFADSFAVRWVTERETKLRFEKTAP